MILVGIYSGWRPQELATLKTADIDLDVNTMKGGMKTDAGKNRIVPIHPIIEKLYCADNEYLFNDEYGQQGTYMPLRTSQRKPTLTGLWHSFKKRYAK